MLMLVARLSLCLAIALPLFAQITEERQVQPEPTSSETTAPQIEAQEPRRELRVIANTTTENRVAKFTGSAGALTDALSIFEAADGKVGIGTTTPTNALHILTTEGAVNAPLKLETSGVDSISGLSLKNDARNWVLRVDGTDGDKFKIYDANAAAYRLTINDIGQIGIRTTTPKATLHVYSDATSDAFVGMGFDPSSASAFNIGYGGLSYGRGAAFMNVRPDALATGVNPSLRLATTNIERMIITNAGNVGVGTSQPSNLLHVAGTARFEGNVFLGKAGVGTSTLYLWPDASGSRLTGTSTGLAIVGQGGSFTVSNADTILSGFGNTALTVKASSVVNSLAANFTNAANQTMMAVASSGNVGIGTSAPTAKLHVLGDMIVTGNITGAKVIGAVYQDLAEWVPATFNMEPGTVVILNPEISNEVMPSNREYDTTVAGVVSAAPGILLGVAGDSKEQIATTGRVKVRVDATRSPIRIGDLLVTGIEPGTAMKSIPVEMSGISMHRPGTIIGKALEPLKSGVGEILVLLSLQ
jgi:hypothetical protein